MGEIQVIIKGNFDIYYIIMIEKETDRAYRSLGFVRTASSHYPDRIEIVYKPFVFNGGN